MSKYLKVFIFVGSLVLFTEVFRLINSARVDLDNKNARVKTQFKKYRASQSLMGGNEYTKEEARAYAYSDCTFNN
tara:strand:+ start:1234 stop:1458 length:225 start_codon:yes stop_codon:yes gene_type:complete